MLAAQQLGAAPRPRMAPIQRRVTAPARGPALVAVARRRAAAVVRAGGVGGVAHPGEESRAEDSKGFDPMMSVPNTTMAKGDMGSGGSLGATMERKPLQFVMPTPVVQGPKLDDGGSGGDDGNHNHNGGGGDDGGGGGDDDDYFGGGDGEGDGDGGYNSGRGFSFELGFLRTLIPESYDALSIKAVFGEWMRTVNDLPMIIRRAVEMGLFSSAQLVRFFSMDVRPGLARSVTRNLPPTWSREFVGRLMADPAFAQKLVLESAFAGAVSMLYEYKLRGDKFAKELDLATINSLGMAAATSATVWLLAPTRSYGSVHKFPWQQMLDGLPNHVFDASGPLRQYSAGARAASFFAKVAELSAVGALTGTVTSLASSAAVSLRRQADPSFEPSTSVPSIQRSSGGLAAYFAANANVRYQLIGGLDRYLFNHSSYLWSYMGISALARMASTSVGEMSRPWWQGLPNPATLPTRPRTKRVSKRVHKRVPKVVARPAAAADTAAPAVAASAAAAVAMEAAPMESVSQVMDAVAAPEASTSAATGAPPADDVAQAAALVGESQLVAAAHVPVMEVVPLDALPLPVEPAAASTPAPAHPGQISA